MQLRVYYRQSIVIDICIVLLIKWIDVAHHTIFVVAVLLLLNLWWFFLLLFFIHLIDLVFCGYLW